MQRNLLVLNHTYIKSFRSQQGDLVYVNYAQTEDFFKLERDMKINCSGKIVIARYGKIFRGNKVKIIFFLFSQYKKYIISYICRNISLKLSENHDSLIFCNTATLWGGHIYWLIDRGFKWGHWSLDQCRSSRRTEQIFPYLQVMPVVYIESIHWVCCCHQYLCFLILSLKIFTKFNFNVNCY